VSQSRKLFGQKKFKYHIIFKKNFFGYILTIFWNIVTLPLMIRVAAVGDDAGPPAVMTTQLPRLSWRVTSDDDLVVFPFDPRILRWNQVRAADRCNEATTIRCEMLFYCALESWHKSDKFTAQNKHNPPKTKRWEEEKLKSWKRICSEVSVNISGNPWKTLQIKTPLS